LDHFSDIPYIVLQQSLMGEETVRAKISFEGYAWQLHVSIMHYHTVNGVFRVKLFQEDVQGQQQTMSYCGI